MQTENDESNNGTDAQTSTKASRTTIIAKEGIQVIKQVGKVVEKNVLTMKEKVDAISKPPPVKQSWKPPENPELFRVGFVELRDVRIFTKEIMSHNRVGGGSGMGGGGSSVGMVVTMNTDKNIPSQLLGGGVDNNDSTTKPSGVEFDNPTTVNSFSSNEPKNRLSLGVNNWSRPILINDVRIYQTDLSPSSYTITSMLKEKNIQSQQSSLSSQASIDTSELIGLEIEQVSNIIMTRMLTEIAKKNPGQLFTNAFTEVCKWFDVEA